jgi:hypothetical protein
MVSKVDLEQISGGTMIMKICNLTGQQATFSDDLEMMMPFFKTQMEFQWMAPNVQKFQTSTFFLKRNPDTQ